MNDQPSLTDITLQPPVWRLPEAIEPACRPVDLWPLLTDGGSLTARLRERCGADFRVKLLRELNIRMPEEYVRWLDQTADPAAMQREVCLCCGDTPWVYARTFFPRRTLVANPQLAALGEQSLGDSVFAAGNVVRNKLEVAQVTSACELGQAVIRSVGLMEGELWARRSHLQLSAGTVLIIECFLPGLQE